MKEINNEELKDVSGGGVGLAVLVGVGIAAVFAVGIISGFTNPRKCN